MIKFLPSGAIEVLTSAALLCATSCSESPQAPGGIRPSPKEGEMVLTRGSLGDDAASPPGGVPIQIWATIYYMIDDVRTVDPEEGVPFRDMDDAVIGPWLSPADWCAAAMEGSVRVDGVVYNHAGLRDPSQADCGDGRIEGVRWMRIEHPYGLGSNSNALVPYRTIACDLGTVEGSTPWTDEGFPEFGQRIYIPSARGTRLPDGTVHDGIFTCADTGSAIIGNHIDVFIGAVKGREAEALQQNPFDFVTSSPDGLVEAYLLPWTAPESPEASTPE